MQLHKIVARLIFLAALALAVAGQCPAGSQVNSLNITNFASPVVGLNYGTQLVNGDNVFCIPVTAPLAAISLPFQVYNDPSFPSADSSDPVFSGTIAKDGIIFVTFVPARFGGGTITAITFVSPLQTPPANAPTPSLALMPTSYYVVTITATNMTAGFNYTAFFQPQAQNVNWEETQGKVFAYSEGTWPGTTLMAALPLTSAGSFKYKMTIPKITTNTTLSYCFTATGPGCIQLPDTCNSNGVASVFVPAGQTSIQGSVALSYGLLLGSNCPPSGITIRLTPNSRTANFYPGLSASYQVQTSSTYNLESSCLSSGALAGIIVGVAVGTAILTALATAFYFQRSDRNAYESLSSPKAI